MWPDHQRRPADIDPVAADWGDFKIRPEQVAVQRAEWTLKALFNEELGVVVQVDKAKRSAFMDILRAHDLSKYAFEVASPNPRDSIEIYRDASASSVRRARSCRQPGHRPQA